MVQEQLIKESVENPPPPNSGNGLNWQIILKFFAIWLSSVLVLVVIALLSNIEWARRYIQASLCQSFHRQVKLGRLSWSFGLQGLAIDTDQFVMRDNNGMPFVSSGPSEIGIAFLPLFQKRLVIKHLQFKHPTVWAVKIDDKRWNFSDLIAEGPEVRMVQIENGTMHLRNEKPEAGDSTASALPESINWQGNGWKSYDVTDIKLSLTLPNKARNWPLFLSCKIPLKNSEGKSYDTALRLSATGKGEFQDWQKNHYAVDLQLKDFDPAKFRPFVTKLPQMSGICDLHFAGEGIFENGFEATASGNVSKLIMQAAANKELQLEKAGASSRLFVSPAKLQWKDLKLSLANWHLDSEGTLRDWQKASASYEARVGGKLNDLKGFFDGVLSSYLPEQTTAAHKKFNESKLDKLRKAQTSGELAAGNATIELRLTGDQKQQSIATNIKADGIPLAQLIDDEVGNNFVEAFKLDPRVPIRGELNITPGKRLEVKDLEIPLEDSVLKMTGFMDEETKQTEFDFSADSMSFDTFKKRLGTDNDFLKALEAANGKTKPYALSGLLDIKGKYKSDGKKPEVFLDGTLKGLRLSRVDSSTPSCTNIRGRIIYENDALEVKQLSGATTAIAGSSAGDFLINGSCHLKDTNHDDMDLRAHEVSIYQLKDWLNRFGVKLQQPGLDRLSGDLHEIRAHVSSRNSKTNTTFTLNPSDLLLSLSGKAGDSQQFRLSSGTISYYNNQLDASDVTLSNRGGKLTVTGIMTGNLESLKLVSAKVKSDGFEIADLQPLLKGSLNPGKPNLAMPQYMVPSSGASLHGKLYGDIILVGQGAGAGMSGVVGFTNAGGKFGKSQVLVEKLTGVAVISKDQLVMQDTSGQIGKSSFQLDGVISNYSSPNYSWQGQLRGQFFPDEVDVIMDNLGHGIGLDSKANEALNLRVTGGGEKGSVNCSFRGRAGATQGLRLKTAFGSFHQPKGRPLSFHGTLNLDDPNSQLALNNFQLTSGNEVLQANGTFKWSNEREERPASLSFSLVTPNPVKSATLLEITSQTQSSNDSPMQVGGTSNLNMKVEGPVNDLVLSGSIALDKNSIPSIHMDNLSGKLDLPGWHISKAGTPDSSGVSIAKLQLSALSMGGMALHDAGATLSVDNNGKIMFKDFQAGLSGGKLTISGFYSPQNQGYHADINISKLVVDEFVKDLIDHSGGVSGLADLSLSLDNSSGGDSPRSLTGSGQFNVYQGSVASFGKLQEKLNESNLLQQGLFGFNVNNLLQAMMPVKSGQFNEVSGKMSISKGNLVFDQIRFEGNNLRMRAAGKFDFVGQNMDMDVAGDIPRVSSSIIPGAIGEMSRKVTLQRMFSIVTFKKLKDLPALPLLGDIANDDPRAFTFSVATPTEPPKLMTQAAEKSFKWLPNKPFASAHPVPGI